MVLMSGGINIIFLMQYIFDNLYAYGTHRGRYNADPSEKYGFMSLFNNDLTLNSPEQWLKNLKLEEEQSLKKIS